VIAEMEPGPYQNPKHEIRNPKKFLELGALMAASRRQQLEALLADDPNDPFLRYGMAMEFSSEGDHDTALRWFNDLIQVQPEYVPAYLQAGQALVRLDREEEAMAVYQAGIAMAKKMGDAHAAGEMEQFLDGIN
jgi:tetratricopeptide (TPR) repeat protein